MERSPTSAGGRATSLVLAASVSLVAIVTTAGLADAQGEDPREVAKRIHRESAYPSDIAPMMPDSIGDGAAGAGRGSRGETSIDGDREAGERGTGETAAPDWLRRIFGWLGDLLGGASSVLGEPIAYLLLAIGLALIAVFIGFLVVHFRLPTPAQRLTASGGAGDHGELDPMLIGPSGTPDDLAAQGRWGEAIHALFLVALDRVGGREGRLRSRTARELVLRVDRAALGREQLAALLDTTELVWFGGRDATEAQYLAARALAAEIPERAPIAHEDEDEEDAA